ncbi:putative FAD-linked oxidoreductase [Symmachiella macrocystis]|uniref:Putative FAD-linked oxidoreductase n=1 Tax=Symmachiella macrocystis TaxID=2527985 RepID=A0A5C6BBN0_9PLAN|nr:FAD-binding oxidoreductase [Symmachiella macrocystis]TWU09483.1 putative FAD-linked oxidoreductase [Symmachiella macrocystis]
MTTTESSDEFTPTTSDEARDFLAENSAGAGRAIFPVGGRTALHYGYAPTQPGFAFSTLRLNRTIDYPARDMTITVEAGIRMDELTEILKAEGQRLPIDVPQSSRATLGGVLATNTSGPRRFGFGTMRDYLIGITSIDAAGKTFSAGGRVVKNVAGYDLCKLMIGSLGTLAVITQVTLKVIPQPEMSQLLWCAAADWQAVEVALENLLTSATRPVALEVLNAAAAHEIAAEARLDLPSSGPILCIGFEGAARETEWQAETMSVELEAAGICDVAVVADAESLWFALTDFATSSDEPLTFQANLRPSRLVEFSELATSAGVSLAAHAGNGIVIGHLPDEVTTLDAAVELLSPLQALAHEADGNLVIFDCDESWKQTIPVFGQARQDRALMQRIKQQLDPRDILNPGRVFTKNAMSAAQ